ncbi:MAG: Holliday junction helicase RuvA, partial [Cyanobacteriota bacterium]
MIQFLVGQAVSLAKNFQGRWQLVLLVNGVGYELQIPQAFAQQLTPLPPEPLQIFTHLLLREDQVTLLGFRQLAERDLFLQLISVSGIGVQLAIALIDTLGIEGLVQAVVTGNLAQLCKTPGVGKKGAERLALELKTKLAQWHKLQTWDETVPNRPQGDLLDELEMTLLALGYTQSEINQAIAALAQSSDLTNNCDLEEWIRQA